MTGFVTLPLTVDEEQMRSEVFERLEAEFPGIQLNENHLETALIEEFCRLLVDENRLAVDVAEEIFREFGRKLVAVAPIDGAAATAQTTWTASDDLGHTIPAGSIVYYARTADDLWGFEVVADAEIAPGSFTALGVTVRALEVGTARNGVAIATELESQESFAWLQSVVLTTATAGGVDPESDATYSSRLALRLRTLGTTAVLPEDFEIIARDVEGVARSRAFDLYDPNTNTWNNEKTVTVAVVAADGTAVGAPVKAAVEAYLEELREVNFVVHVIDPTYTDVHVNFTALATDDADPATVQAAAIQAVTDYLDPANWGDDPNTTLAEWLADDSVYYLEVAEVINRVPGVKRITALTLAKGAGAPAAADIVLDGVAPLPSVVEVGGSTVVGVVN